MTPHSRRPAGQIQQPGQPVQQSVGGSGAISTDQQLFAVRSGDLGDRRRQHIAVISGGVGPGITRAQSGSQQFGGVVTPHPDRVKPEGALERWRRLRFLAVRHHDRGVDVEGHYLNQVGIGDPRCRQPIRQLCPHVTTHPGPGRLDLGQSRRAQLITGAPHRRRRGHRTQHRQLVAQHVDISDDLPAIGQQHCHVNKHPSPVMTQAKRVARQRLGHLAGQATRSASSRKPALPAWATTPVPSPDTDNHQIPTTRANDQLIARSGGPGTKPCAATPSDSETSPATDCAHCCTAARHRSDRRPCMADSAYLQWLFRKQPDRCWHAIPALLPHRPRTSSHEVQCSPAQITHLATLCASSLINALQQRYVHLGFKPQA